MRRLSLFAPVVALIAGCTGGTHKPDGGHHPPTDPTGTTPITTEPPPTTDTTVPPTDTTDPTGTDCAVDPSLTVVSATPSPGMFDTLLQVDVTLSAPAAVAVQCTSNEEPEEIFFAEDLTETDVHEIHLTGLLPRSTYRCTAAPTCPTMAGGAAAFDWTTGDAPQDLKQLTVEIDPTLGMDGAWTLAPYGQSAFFSQTWLVIWGPEGRPRWWYPTPSGVGVWIEARYDVEAADIVWGGGFDPDGRIRSVDLWEGETYDWAPAGWENTEFHHDGKRIEDGRLMTLEIRDNSGGGQSWDGFGLRIHDPVDGSIDFDFDSQSLVDAGNLGFGSFFDSDPYHANWMDWHETATGPEAYVSLCFAWQILALDGTTGELKWQLGRDLGWTILDENGDPLDQDALPSCQHGIEVDGDKLLVYDNGQDQSQSEAEEWQIDPATSTITRLWSWQEAGWAEDYLGDIDYLPNDRVLITEATGFGAADIVEVDRATGAVASRMSFDDGGYTYRSDRYDGCTLFTSVRYCDTLAARYSELSSLLAE